MGIVIPLVILALVAGFGLILALGKDDSQDALRPSSRATCGSLQPGQRVWIEGIARSTSPVHGKLATDPAIYIERTVTFPNNRRANRGSDAIRSATWADFAVEDAAGSVAVEPRDDAMVMTGASAVGLTTGDPLDGAAGPIVHELGLPSSLMAPYSVREQIIAVGAQVVVSGMVHKSSQSVFLKVGPKDLVASGTAKGVRGLWGMASLVGWGVIVVSCALAVAVVVGGGFKRPEETATPKGELRNFQAAPIRSGKQP